MPPVRAGDLLEFERPPVDPQTVWVRAAPWWLRLVWRPPFVGIALPWSVYLRVAPEAVDETRLRQILEHELVHIAQWRELGIRRFIRSYVGDYVAGRRSGLGHLGAYAAIGLECDPRLKADT